MPNERLEQVLKVAQDLERENSRLLAALAEAERRGDLLEADLRRLNSRDDGPLQQVREELERTNRAKLLAEARAEQFSSLASAQTRAADLLRHSFARMEAEHAAAQERIESLSRAAADAAAHHLTEQREMDERLSQTLRHLQERQRAQRSALSHSAIHEADERAREAGEAMGSATQERAEAATSSHHAHEAPSPRDAATAEPTVPPDGASESLAPGATVDLTARMSTQSWVHGPAGAWRVARGAPMGHAIYGPYVQLAPGRYRARVEVEAKPQEYGHASFAVDVAISSRVSPATTVIARVEDSLTVDFVIPRTAEAALAEIRVLRLAPADLEIGPVRLTALSAEPAA